MTSVSFHGKKGVNFGNEGTQSGPASKPLPDLHKTRPESPEHVGQAWWKELQLEKYARNRRLGFERLGHMHSVGIPFKFEELQGRHPFDFIDDVKEHFQKPPKPGERSQRQVKIDDFTLLPIREWLEPLRKGQTYWDYCRDKWMSKVSQLGAALGPASSTYSLWSITLEFLRHGRPAFLIAYLIVTLLFTIPITYMELTIGQFHRFGVVRSMTQVCPLMMGVGYFMLMICTVDYVLSLTRLSWILFYMASSLRPQFPWKSCDNQWDSKRCKETNTYNETNVSYAEGELTPAVEFFRTNVMRQLSNKTKQKGNSEFFSNSPNMEVILCFLCLLIFLYFLTRMRCKEMGRKMYFTFQLTFFLILFSFATRSFVVPEDHEERIVESVFQGFNLFNKQLSYLTDKDTWLAAIKHAIISSGVGTGIHVTFGSHNPFINHEIKYNAVVTGFISFLLHSTVAIFFTLCHASLAMTDSFNKSDGAYGSDTIFEIFPQLAAQHQPSRGYCWLMFNSMMGALLLLGLLRGMCCLHTIQQYFCDRDKSYYEPVRTDFNYWETQRAFRQRRLTLWKLSSSRKRVLMAKILFLLGMIQLLTFFPGGAFYLEIVEKLWYKYILVFGILLECLVVFFFLGVRLLNSYIRKMTTWQATLWSRFVWKSFTPIFPILYFIHLQPFLDPDEDHVSYLGGFYKYLGILCWVILFFLLVVQIVWVLNRAPGKDFRHRLLLLATPEHDHADVFKGVKPLTRLHWMHHTAVPSGISRGACLQPKSHKRPIVRFNYPWLDEYVWHALWNRLGLKFLNKGEVYSCSCVPKYHGPIRATELLMFSPTPMELKPEKEAPAPEYLPNQQIANVINMRRKPAQGYRKQWIKEKINLQTDKMKAELQAIEENERKRKSVTQKAVSISVKSSNLQESSSSEEDSSEDSASDEWEDTEVSPGMSPDDEGSSDDSESDDWEHFSDHSILSTESSDDEVVGEAGKPKRTMENSFDDNSFQERDISVENLLVREKEYFETFRIDELEEFEDIMDEEQEEKVPTDHWSESTSETDTDESSDTIRKDLERSGMNDEDNVVISDVDDLVIPKKRKKNKESTFQNERFSTVSRGMMKDGDDSFSSCSTSCSSGGSDWSKRSGGAPGLAEDRAMLIRRGSKRPTLTLTGDKKSKSLLSARMSMDIGRAGERGEGNRKSIQAGKSADLTVYTDINQGLKGFLSRSKPRKTYDFDPPV